MGVSVARLFKKEGGMRRGTACIIACLVLCLGVTRADWVGAQETAQLSAEEVSALRELLKEREVPPMPAKVVPQFSDDEVSMVRGFLEKFKGIEFGGFVENFYMYEGSNPNPGFNNTAVGAKVFDREENSFTLNNIELWLYKEAANPGDVGFKITTNYGEQAHRMTFVPAPDINGSSIANPAGRVDDDDFTVTEGYALWNIPIGKGLLLKFGKFATWVGYEVWEAHWNPNFSRNYIYGWGIPFTNQGVGLSYPVTDNFTFNYYFVHDTDAFAANTEGKGHGLDLAYSAPDLPFFHNLSIDLDTFWFPQRFNETTTVVEFDPDNIIGIDKNGVKVSPAVDVTKAGHERWWSHIYDLQIKYDPLSWLSVGHNFNFWHANRPGRTFTSWAYAQYLVFTINDRMNVGLRGTYFWDHDGRALLFGNPAAGLETTATLNLKIREKLWIRPEVRWDKITAAHGENSSHVFKGGRDRSNVTGSVAITYEF